MKLTAVIICPFQSGRGVEAARNSVAFADEILVEEYPSIADYAAARNEALEKARGEWVLFVDADEEVPPMLADEIARVLAAPEIGHRKSDVGYRIRRDDKFLGKWLKHGETASVRLMRLARRDAGRWVRPVHEVWKISGRTGKLCHPLRHDAHRSVAEMVEKLDRYSELEGEYRSGKLGGAAEMVIFPLGKFIQNYVLRLGFLDGMEGFIHAAMMSFHSFLVRAKQLSREGEVRGGA